MPDVTKGFLSSGLAAVFVSVALAQGERPAEKFQVTDLTVLVREPVQSELKLTAAQKEKIGNISAKLTNDLRDTKFADRETVARICAAANKSTAEFVKEELKAEQVKRLKQLSMQLSLQLSMRKPSALDIFTDEEVLKALQLADKPKEMIQAIVAEFRKSTQAVREAASASRERKNAAREKVGVLRKEAMDKITGCFTEQQKRIWKDLVGEDFDFQL